MAAAFLALLAGAAFTGKLPYAVLDLYLIASASAFIAYAFDKSAAKNNQWRIKESTLHLFALACGWPGALLAQKTFRHKSKKEKFQTVFWATVIINCVALGWLLTKSGSAFLSSILGQAA